MPSIGAWVVAAISPSSMRKCVKPCWTVPASTLHSAAAGASARAAPASNGASRQAVEGNSIIPPRRPLSGRRGRAVEGDRGNCIGRVVADPRQRPQPGDLIGEPTAMPLDNRADAGMQVAGAGVIAEPLPLMQHLVERSFGQRRKAGPARDE